MIMNLNWEQPSRRLPPELLAEIHKCLPLADAINVLVNVPSRAIYQNNSPRMRRTIQRIKTTLREYIHPLALKNDENEGNNIAELVENGNNDSKLYKSINIDGILPWSPKMDLLFRYGAWLLPTRNFFMNHQNSFLFGVPKDFVENLIDHLANSIMVENALEIVQIQFGPGNELPQSLMQLLEQAKMCSAGRSGRILLESIDLKIGENNVHIFDGELNGGGDELTIHLMNRKDPRKWFEIRIILLMGSRNYIRGFEFSAIQPTNEYMEDGYLLSGHYQILRRSSHIWSHQMDTFLRRGAEFTHFRHFQIDKITECPPYYAEELICYMAYTKNPEYVLELMDIKIEYSAMSKMFHQIWNFCRKGIPKGNILWNSKLDMFLRRGVAFTKFRHFKINENYHIYRIPTSYVDFLISYISNTKYPEQFLQSIDIQFSNCLCSSFIDKIYPNEIPKGGKFINVGSNKKLHILSAVKPEMKQLEGSSTIGEYKLEFTLANLATNGKYVFDFDVQTKRGFSRIIGMKIQKRMVDEIAESNYNDNGQNEKGKKRKITKEEEKDKPTYYSGKIMKK